MTFKLVVWEQFRFSDSIDFSDRISHENYILLKRNRFKIFFMLMEATIVITECNVKKNWTNLILKSDSLVILSLFHFFSRYIKWNWMHLVIECCLNAVLVVAKQFATRLWWYWEQHLNGFSNQSCLNHVIAQSLAVRFNGKS